MIIKHLFSKPLETTGIASLEKDSQRSGDYAARMGRGAKYLVIPTEKEACVWLKCEKNKNRLTFSKKDLPPEERCVILIKE